MVILLDAFMMAVAVVLAYEWGEPAHFHNYILAGLVGLVCCVCFIHSWLQD